MNFFKKIFVRTFQFFLYKACYLMPFREPEIIDGEDSYNKLSLKIKELNLKKVMFVVDPGILKLNLHIKVVESFNNNSIDYVLFSKIEPNPKTNDIEEGVTLFKEETCDSLVVIGGGSAMDTAKAIGARIARPNKFRLYSLFQLPQELVVKQQLRP